MKPQKFKQTEIGKIPEDWDVKTIIDLALIKSGKRLPKGEDVVSYKTGFPYIRIRDLQDMSVKSSEVLFLKPEVQKKISKYIIKNEDIYISIVGTIGLVGIIPPELNGANLTENCARLTELKVNRDYLKYFLNSKFGQNQITSLIVGTTQGKLALSRIAKIVIPVPNLSEQMSIASILSSLDAKIELNNRMNKTLEAIGQLIFKKEFIDGAKKEWGISKIGKELKTILGGTPDRTNSEYWNGNINWINSGAINDFPIINASEKITELGLNKSATQLMPEKTIVLPFVISVGKNVSISILGIKTAGNQSVLGIVPNEEFSSSFIYYHIQNQKNEIYSSVTGGAQQHINKANVDNTPLIIPDAKSLKRFNLLVEPLIDLVLKNALQSQTLSSIRDSLLPKLMSGEIRVK